MRSTALRLVIAVFSLVMLSSCLTRTINESFTNEGVIAHKYIAVEMAIWHFDTAFPAATSWYNSNTPTAVRGVDQDDDGSDYHRWILYFEVNADPGQTVHIGGTLVDRQYISVKSTRFEDKIPGQRPAFALTSLNPSDSTQFAGLGFDVLSISPAYEVRVSNSASSPTSAVLTSLQWVAYGAEVPLDSLSWGNSLLESLPWTNPSGPALPLTLTPGTSAIYSVPSSSVPLDEFQLIRWRCTPTGGSSPNREGVVQMEPGGVLGVGAPSSGTPATRLLVPRPVPTRGRVQLAFNLATKASVELAIYDVRGVKMGLLADGSWEMGLHTVEWDGRDARGRSAPAGVYYARFLVSHRLIEARRVVLER